MIDNMNIMVVDNDPEIIKSTWRVLNQDGHSVDGVFSGKEAILTLKHNHYDLVFTELSMPGIDGITLIKWMKQYRPSTGIVAMTARPLKLSVQEAYSLGAISHILKPFTPELLRKVTIRTIEWLKDNPLRTRQEAHIQPDIFSKVDDIIDQYDHNSHRVIQVLLNAQEILGYLPPLLQNYIARELNMNPSEVRRIVSFYSCFRAKPEIEHALNHTSAYERAWSSVKWMTGSKAKQAVSEFIKTRHSI